MFDSRQSALSCMQVPGAIQESYYFKVNGVPVFFKGANVIPLSVFPSNVTAELVEATLEAAVEANQNLLRVWGGGLYHVSSQQALHQHRACRAFYCTVASSIQYAPF